MPTIPDIVKNAKLETEIHPEYTRHFRYHSGQTLKERYTRVEERWKRQRHLGEGSFGVVWLESKIQDGDDGQLRAVKTLLKSGTSNCYAELEAVALFSHQKYRACFVESFGWFEDANSIFITMEFLPKGDLQGYLAEPLAESETQRIVSQLLEGLTFMHQNNFAHRDLKPTNILVKCAGPDWWVKISDFGISKRAAEGQTALRTQTGTLAFAAPEIFGLVSVDDENQERIYTNAVDVWSIGAITFRILTGQVPFKDLRALSLYAVGHIKFPQALLLEKQVTEPGRNFTISAMSSIADERPIVTELARHAWMNLALVSDILVNQRYLQSTANNLDNPSTGYASARWSTLNSYRPDQKLSPDDEHFVDLTKTSSVFRYDLHAIDSLTSNEELSTSATSVTMDEVPSNMNEFNNFVHQTASLNQTGTVVADNSELAATGQLKQDMVTKRKSVPSTSDMDDFDESLHENSSSLDVRKTAYQFFGSEHYPLTEKSFKHAAAICEKVLGRDHTDTAESLQWLGHAQYDQQKYQKAEESFRDAATICEKVLGRDHTNTAWSLQWLGHAQYDQQNYQEAEESFREAATICEKVLGRDHTDTARSLHWLGRAQHKQQKYHEAEELFREAATICEKVLGRDHTDTARSLHWLGHAQSLQKKYHEAEELFRDAATIYEKVLGRDHVDTAGSLYWLGYTQYDQRKYRKAEESFRDSATIYKKVLGRDHTETAKSLYWLGRAQCDQRKYREAEQSFRDTATIYEKVLSRDHTDTAESLQWLGHAQYHQWKYREAEESFRDAATICEKVLGRDHTNTAWSLQWLGHAQYDQQNYQEAEESFRDAATIYEKVLGREHRDTMNSRSWLLKVQDR